MKKIIALILLLILLPILSIALARAETRYVLVQDELNVRARPSLGSHVHGRLFTGDSVEVSKTYNGWCYLEGLHSEEGVGWVSGKYVVSDPVTEMSDSVAVIQASGRVAIRDCVDGKRIAWAHPGDVVSVYGMSDSWSVTDRGYVKTEYLVFK